MSEERIYIAIDLKSFYASVECVERGLDPLTTNLVVADETRTEKTICLAVSPSLKSYGISGRARLFEVIERVKEVNANRRKLAPGGRLEGESWHDPDLARDPSLALSYLVARPQMNRYLEVSTRIHEIYLHYVAPEDLFVYSIDEVFIDVTSYMEIYRMSAHDLAMKMMLDVLSQTGITATAGIGTNLYLCKVAMDIVAKHVPADENGVRIAELDEASYRSRLWSHRPITDFWRVGRGYAGRLERLGIYTMGDIAEYSLEQAGEDVLYQTFGVAAELLIDHAWGYEPCRMEDIKAYKPSSNSLSSGQVLKTPYDYEATRLIVKEMTESLTLELVAKRLVTDQLVLTLGYDASNLSDPARRGAYQGAVKLDRYNRPVPKHAHGTTNLDRPTSSTRQIMQAVMALYERIADPRLLVRRINLTAARVVDEDSAGGEPVMEQLDLFTDYAAKEEEQRKQQAALQKERRMQEAAVAIRQKYGKNALLKGMDLQEGATSIERNTTIGGHKA